MKIVINMYNIEDFFKYNVCYTDNDTYIISINSDLTEDFISLFNKQELIYEINEIIEVLDDNNNIEKLEYLKYNLDKIIYNIIDIDFNYNDLELIKYIEKNPILKTKKIVLNKDLDYDLTSLELLKNKLNNIDNIYFKLSKNYEPISYNEYYKTLKIINGITTNIKKYNFSPLETVFYVYDLVRDRNYNSEEENQDFTVSRDLTKTLLGDKIVCEGFSRLFSTILNKLGINCIEIELDNPNSIYNHSRNQIYLKDDKYNIDGVYYLDTTFDCKKDTSNKHFLSYKWFLKTREEMNELDNNKYIYTNIPIYSTELPTELYKEFNNNGFKNINKDTFKSINNMSKTITNKKLIEPINYIPLSPLYEKIDIENVCEELSYILDYFNRPISGNILIKALFNVRKNQYYQDSEKYPFSLNDFYYTILKSNWAILTAEERLLKAILGEDIKIDTLNNYIKLINKEQLPEKIENIKLTKTLRLIVEKNL